MERPVFADEPKLRTDKGVGCSTDFRYSGCFDAPYSMAAAFQMSKDRLTLCATNSGTRRQSSESRSTFAEGDHTLRVTATAKR